MRSLRINYELIVRLHDAKLSSEAAQIFEKMMTGADFTEFLTLAAYGSID